MHSDTELSALKDISEHIALAFGFVDGLSLEQFEADTRTFYATVRCLEIISEASRKMSVQTKARYTDVPWRDIAGAGNVYRHDYENIAHRLVWGTVKNALPDLQKAIAQALKSAEKP